MRNNINHSVCQWCFNDTPLEDFLIIIKDLGVTAIDLIGPKDWPLLAKHGVHCAMCNGAEISLEQGWNNLKYHHQLIKNYTELIPQVAAAGYTNLICFSGNNDGLDKETGLQNCVDGLSKILPLAEKYNVVLQMELFNQIDHPDYMCDSSEWGVNLCKKLDSTSFKLLFDIYHMQIQEGDIIRTIKENHKYFGHYHTAGVPGRNEIDHTQEINYSAVMKTIVDTGFKGYVAQEFMPLSKNKIQSLRESFLICDV
ncbi:MULTISPECIES: hydroxypyruvate isomerase family protein [unclassified Cellulophaga]|uniref:hydroxypyruvate isomerase family protein n=1 Tax=unclassified Cellulophaga TaxID=2634405 RepID=UPI0026E13D52|nr:MULTISPECIES: TIM barrel protein [unclassified Cellulophaga]MDO6492382.1 TIM barrel protein [Cellulophaga sp. 2_MG-2023]MDO6496118.1 TIM barrel protein [Cellulophaga sp. 3_MG-2023]